MREGGEAGGVVVAHHVVHPGVEVGRRRVVLVAQVQHPHLLVAGRIRVNSAEAAQTTYRI